MHKNYTKFVKMHKRIYRTKVERFLIARHKNTTKTYIKTNTNQYGFQKVTGETTEHIGLD
jgi:hypothetical protein